MKRYVPFFVILSLLCCYNCSSAESKNFQAKNSENILLDKIPENDQILEENSTVDSTIVEVHEQIVAQKNEVEVTDAVLKRVQEFEKEALDFCVKKNFNTSYFILIDMKVPSGKNRFYLYNFKEKKIVYRTLATHGSCDVFEDNSNYSEAKFSNSADSHCSSKGKYKIAERGTSIWSLGIKYVLDGLEESNKNARSRAIVLHSWEIIPENEIYPKDIALSWGCPAISNDSFRYIDTFIQKQQNKSILLWIVD